MASDNDKLVLNAIFNPNTPFEVQNEEAIDAKTKSDYKTNDAIDAAKKLELEGVKSAENGDIKSSLKYFTQAIETAPEWASAYNNRAQAHRLLNNVDGGQANGTLDDLLYNQRNERKVLQAKIQSLKKSVTKGDRKKKKEIDTQIALLEKEFDEKCELEVKKFKEPQQSQVESKPDENKQEQIEAATSTANQTVDGVSQEPGKNSKNKNKKRQKQEKKDQRNRERDEQIAIQEIENENGPAALELKEIVKKLKEKGLEIKDMRSDGNCMYYAISDQLSEKLNIVKTFEELRLLTSEYMLEKPDEFKPFVCAELYSSADENDEFYQSYCDNVRNSDAWGGQIELKAISDALRVNIEVVQANSSNVAIGDYSQENTESLVLTYHRLLFGSGEHYNSTQPLSENKSDEDDE